MERANLLDRDYNRGIINLKNWDSQKINKEQESNNRDIEYNRGIRNLKNLEFSKNYKETELNWTQGIGNLQKLPAY